MISAKAFDIPKKLVWDAYLDVKKSGGGPGIDGQSMEEFEADLKNNLYKIGTACRRGATSRHLSFELKSRRQTAV